MQLLKINHGLLEAENFFLYSPASDFLGANQYRRDHTSFTLIDGVIERVLPYENYCIIVHKDSQPVGSVEAVHFYVRQQMQRFGITETSVGNDVMTPYYKLIKHKGMLQAYSSQDGTHWDNLGGWNVNSQEVQGFAIEKQPNSALELKLLDYKIYRSPYLTVGGLYDKEFVVLKKGNVIIDEKVANGTGVVDLFLTHNFEGTVEIYSDTGKDVLLYTETLTCEMGDEYVLADQNLIFTYKAEQLTFIPTLLRESVAEIVMHNLTDNPIVDVELGIDYSGEHFITLSIDGTTYAPSILIPSVEVGETPLFIKIKRNYNAPITSRIQDFSLVVNM